MAKQKLILVPSEAMDKNKKTDRNEHGLIRMGKAAREELGFKNHVELYPDTTDSSKRINGSMLLDVFQAFSEDIKKAKGTYSEDELKRIGFVTSKTFRKITGSSKKEDKNIWITNDAEDIVIGSDPEFLLFNDDGEVIRANEVISYTGKIGCDGAMAEVRPPPAISPEDLTRNIELLFKNEKLISPIKPYRWEAGCYHIDNRRDYPIGGHLHFGNPVKITRINTERRYEFFNVVNRIVDELLSVPMIKVDGKELGKARRTNCRMSSGGGYGYFGEWRPCNGHMEHRTLSGMWLMHPILATMVFGVAKAIVDEIYVYVVDKDYDQEYMFPTKFRRAEIWKPSFKEWAEMPLAKDMGCIKDSSMMISLLHNSDPRNITSKFLKTWYDRMKGLSTYEKYAKYIDGLYEILKHNTKTFLDYDRDIKKNWLEKTKFID